MKHYWFDVHPRPGSRLFVRVMVFKGRRDFDQAAKVISHGSVLRGKKGDRRGLCSENIRWTCTKKRARRDPRIATVLLMADDLGGEVVSHEMTHAACAWMRRKKMDGSRITTPEGGLIPERAPEEQLCMTVGTLVRQTYLGLRDLGLVA